MKLRFPSDLELVLLTDLSDRETETVVADGEDRVRCGNIRVGVYCLKVIGNGDPDIVGILVGERAAHHIGPIYRIRPGPCFEV